MPTSTALAQELDKKAKEEINVTPTSEAQEGKILDDIASKKEDLPKDSKVVKEDLSPKVEEKLDKKYWKEQNEKRKDPEKVGVIPPPSLVKEDGFNVINFVIAVGLTVLAFMGFKLFKKSLENQQITDDKGTDTQGNVSIESEETIWLHLQGKPYDH